MNAWVECFVSVRFDLDVGPRVEHVSPRNMLTEEGERLVAQAAFPDCNPDCGHEFIFFFAIRGGILRSSLSEGCGFSKHQVGELLSSEAAPHLRSSSIDDDMVSNGSFPSGMYGLARVGGQAILNGSMRSVNNSASAGAPPADAGAPPRSSSSRFCGPPLGDENQLLGVAHYRQKRDTSVPRGYVQQVFLLLSRLPYLVVHELILRVVAPRCNQCCHLSPDTTRTNVSSAMGPVPSSMFAFDASFHPSHASQSDVLDQAFAEVSSWPSPHPHVQYAVSLLNQSFSFVTPPREVRPLRSLQLQRVSKVMLDERVRILDKRQPIRHSQDFFPLYHLLGDHLADMTKLWELLVSHEHLLILSNTPSMSSAVALAVVSLIMPIKFVGDLRTYFTVQDADFTLLSRLGKKERAFPAHHSVIVSGTNPFFVRAFVGWRHLLSVCDQFSTRVVSGRGLAAPLDESSSSCDPFSPTRSGLEERVPSSTAIGDTHSPSTPTPLSGGRSSGKDAWASLQWGFSNMFQTHNHSFVLNHKDQSAILQDRVSQCLKLPAEVQRMSTEEAASRDLAGGDVPCAKFMSSSPASPSKPPPPTSTMFPTTLVDEMVRRFFFSLTTEFLSPVRLWFEDTVKRSCEPFQLCCSGILETPLFHPSKFLAYLSDHRKTIAPPMFRDKTPHRSYKVLYERFAGGVLFRSFLGQLASLWIERELDSYQADTWACEFPGVERRVDMFINLHTFALIEFESHDPDLVLLASATAVLTEMAVRLPPHLQDSFLNKVEMLRLP